MAKEATFADVEHLGYSDIYILVHEIDQNDLLMALGGTTKQQREHILFCMSKNLRASIEEKIGSVKASKAEVEEVQRKIVAQAERLAARGEMTWPPGAERTFPKGRLRKPKATRELTQRLRKGLSINYFSVLSIKRINE